MPTQTAALAPNQTNPPRQPLLPLKKIYGLELGKTSQLLRAANPLNRGIRVENRMDVDLYLSITGSPATDANIRIRANEDMEWPVGVIQEMWILAPGAKKDGVVVLHEFI